MQDKNIEQDIVDELYDWDYIIEESQGKAHVIMISGAVYRAAAEEIVKLRKQIELAHNILASEAMIWLIAGSEYQNAQLNELKDPVKNYWNEYGNFFNERSSDEL